MTFVMEIIAGHSEDGQSAQGMLLRCWQGLEDCVEIRQCILFENTGGQAWPYG